VTSLIKFCRPEHNLVNGCYTIQLGTLEYYRDMDQSSHLADCSEGVESVIVRSINTGSCSIEAARVIAPVIDMPHVHVRNLALSLTTPNCYVWCCSRLTEPIDGSAGSRFDPAYNSLFRIDDAGIFAAQVAALLMTYVKLTGFSDEARRLIEGLPVGEFGQVALHWHHAEVQYVDQKKSEVVDGQLAPYGEALPVPFRQLFTKPIRYGDDREYRFAFWFQHPRCGMLSVRKDPLILPVLPISTTGVLASTV